MKDFTEELRQLPDSPGVYLMFDASNTIIYVGKAISLKRRVRSYFQKSNSGKTPKVLAMVEHVDHFEYILVENEVEALVLESNFIKEHAPKYNILLRDDKQYPYIKLTKETYPRILKVRQVHNDGGTYFGPFPNAYAVNDIIKLLQRVYQIRSCSLDIDGGKRLKRPCLYYFIHQCPGPCVDKVDPQKYQEAMDEIRRFLNGHDETIRAMLTENMREAAGELNFERAAAFRDDLVHLDELMAKQEVTFVNGMDADIIAMARGSNRITIQVFFQRGGKVVDRQHFSIREEYQDQRAEVLSSFLKQFYLDAPYIPKEIVVEEAPTDREALEAFLSQKKGQKVRIFVPQRGKKNELLKTAQNNAEEQLTLLERREARKERNTDRGIHELEERLGLSGIHRVEAYDISNTSGVQNVGSMVVYDRERKQPREYRKFKIRTVEGINEYASQREMLRRRFDHGLRDRAEGKTRTGFGALPDLIMMDGGKGQVNLCQDILRARELSIPVVGLVKDDKHRTRALLYNNKEYALNPRSPLYKYLYAVQEEVHRFAISYHRKLRSKEMVHSQLDDIPGIGPARKRALLDRFHTVEEINKASPEELRAVPGISEKQAKRIVTFLAQEHKK